MGVEESEIRARVRRLVRQRGATAAARVMRMQRETLLAVAADADVQDGTIALAGQRLREIQGDDR
jgi:nicotinate-nucleotide pyrophosphorylase